ncbi:endonuclease/exonuclease/phosphatase family protein [Streptomyces sp. CC208A]|uniref:endonuclease/exonuclease/phosphatase family protein n=1 Tax=Streptomyces sp. CC208A TaxID=3044573 RepID=UPI0024A7F982|nr:endonuclease/exonuclease/phosphatase family protein [Streptomyces sp. CC208A]
MTTTLPPAGTDVPAGTGDPTGTGAPAAVPERVSGRARRTVRVLRLWYGRAVLGAAVVWLAYAVLRWLVSGRWHWSIVLDVVPPLFLLGAPLLLLVAAAAACGRRRPLAAVASGLALALALTTGSGLNWPALWREPGPAPAGALRVVSLNTQYWAMATGSDRLIALLRSRDADVYLLQEHVGWTPGLGEDGYWRIDDDAALRRAFPGYHVARRGELLTLSRFPIVAQRLVGPGPRLTFGRKPDFGQEFAREKVLRTDIAVGGRVLSTYNVHITVPLALDNLNPFSGFDHDGYLRRKHAWRQEEFEGLERDVRANDRPLLIAGDFNATASMRPLRRLAEVAEDATPANPSFLPLSWKFASLGEFGEDVLFNRDLPFFRVDWAFTKGGTTVHRYDLLPTDGISEHRMQELRIML